MNGKEIWWVGNALDELRQFPEHARRLAGHQLHLIQLGLDPKDWKPMPSAGPGVVELRLHGETERRVFYLASFPEGIYVLHAFEKKTEQTAQRDIEIGRKRSREVLRWRHEQEL